MLLSLPGLASLLVAFEYRFKNMEEDTRSYKQELKTC